MVNLQSLTINIKGTTYVVLPMDGYLSAQRLNELAEALSTPETPKVTTWNVKTAGRRITAKLAPYGLKKDGSPAKKRGRPAK